MRELRESIAVNAPASFALATINTYFLERGPHGAAQIALRFPVPTFIVSGLTLEKMVSLKLDYGALDSNAKTIVFGWQPVGTRALPNFSGTVRALPSGADACRISIEGSYVAPGGSLGGLFDTLIGVRIARATLVTLLEQFSRAIESDYCARR